MASNTRIERVNNYYKNKIENVELLIDNVHDVHNVAAICRSADGLGIKKINLYYTYNKFADLKKHGKLSSSTANKWIEWGKIEDLAEFVKQKKKEGYVFIGAIMNSSSKNIVDFKFGEKAIIVFGNEHKGLSKEIEEICDAFVFIPM